MALKIKTWHFGVTIIMDGSLLEGFQGLSTIDYGLMETHFSDGGEHKAHASAPASYRLHHSFDLLL